MEYEKGILGVNHAWEVQHTFCSSLLPPCVHFSPWRKVVLNGGLEQNKGTNEIRINPCKIQGVFKDFYVFLWHSRVFQGPWQNL